LLKEDTQTKVSLEQIPLWMEHFSKVDYFLEESCFP